MKKAHLALYHVESIFYELGISLSDFYVISIDGYDRMHTVNPLRIKFQGQFSSELVLKINKLGSLEKLMVDADSGYVEGIFEATLNDWSFQIQFILT